MVSEDNSDQPDIFSHLLREEVVWRDRHEFLEGRGYMLRPRLRPGWTPSWRGKPDDAVFEAEDGVPLPFRANVVDATRTSDGRLVYLKRVRDDSHELEILSYLTSKDMLRDPRNHCIPLLDVFPDPIESGKKIMVMPFMRYIDSPPFETVEDVLECLDQVLEGLVFIHDHDVAHRDCAYKNVMMDASALFPQGFHPDMDYKLPDMSAPAPVLSRSVAPVRYYLIDFGISTRFTPDMPRLVVGRDGLDQEPPELSSTVPYDPFKLDVFLIGNLIRRRIYEKYSNLGMLEPLMNRMVDADPAKRSTAAETHRELKAIRRNMSQIRKYWHLQPRDSNPVAAALRNVYSLFYAIYRSLF
ncbi:hypothetical protein FKP32DRAFT_1592487 [Trametes sanguinea]|nr:hypothetical protein FKP32DRAFT_1592487 [Trametes sanguinea]